MMGFSFPECTPQTLWALCCSQNCLGDKETWNYVEKFWAKPAICVVTPCPLRSHHVHHPPSLQCICIRFSCRNVSDNIPTWSYICLLIIKAPKRGRCDSYLQSLELWPTYSLTAWQVLGGAILSKKLPFSDLNIMAKFLLLLLPMALGQTSLEGAEVKVTTVTHRPYIMPKHLSSGERWPEKANFMMCLRFFEGFLVDMLKALSKMLDFTYTIHENPDKRYGQNTGGTWTGMIGEVNTLSQHFFPHFSSGFFVLFPIFL